MCENEDALLPSSAIQYGKQASGDHFAGSIYANKSFLVGFVTYKNSTVLPGICFKELQGYILRV